MAELNDRQRAFVREYLVDFNATQAAVRAGYSKKTARQQASAMLLSNLDVQRAIRAATERRVAKAEINAERVLRELARISFSDPRGLFHADGSMKAIHELDDEAAAAISSVEFADGGIKKVRLWDKGSALALLAKHTGVLIDGPQVQINILSNPVWLSIRAVLMDALEPFPKAREAVTAALREHASSNGDSQR